MKYARVFLLFLFMLVLTLSAQADGQRGMQVVPKDHRYALLIGTPATVLNKAAGFLNQYSGAINRMAQAVTKAETLCRDAEEKTSSAFNRIAGSIQG